VPSLRQVIRATALVAAVALAYVGGVVTGVVGTHRPADPSSAHRGVIDEAAGRIASQAAQPVDPKALERAAVEGMLSQLGDRWSSYYGASQFSSFEDALDGHYSGVGLWLRRASVDGIVVGSVQAGSPAAKAGLRAEDVLVRVGHHDVRHADVAAVAEMLRGPEHTRVALLVRRHGVVRDLVLRRTTFTTDDVVVEHLRGDISRVRITAFTRGVGRQVRQALHSDRHSGGVILDLRDNPGGLLSEAVEVASAFLDGGPVVSYQRRGLPLRTLDAFPGGDVTTPLVVLVDSSSASAAEVVAAALQERNRAVVVGSRTFGKGSVQEPSRLSDGSAIELTVGHYLTPDGRSIDGVGVEPDVLVPPAEPPQVAERRAIEVLAGLLAALNGTGRG
jgi:carboxyl-terminal processing protease